MNLVTEFREAQAQEFQDIAETSLEEGECGLFRVDRSAGLMTFLRGSTNPKRNCWVSIGTNPMRSLNFKAEEGHRLALWTIPNASPEQ